MSCGGHHKVPYQSSPPNKTHWLRAPVLDAGNVHLGPTSKKPSRLPNTSRKHSGIPFPLLRMSPPIWVNVLGFRRLALVIRYDARTSNHPLPCSTRILASRSTSPLQHISVLMTSCMGIGESCPVKHIVHCRCPSTSVKYSISEGSLVMEKLMSSIHVGKDLQDVAKCHDQQLN